MTLYLKKKTLARKKNIVLAYNIGSGCVLITAMPHCMIGLGT